MFLNIGNNKELLYVIEAIAKEKDVPKDCIFSVVERAFGVVARKKYGASNRIEVVIDKKSGDLNIHRELKVVENPSDISTQIALPKALRINSDAKVSDIIFEHLPNIDIDRKSATLMREFIVSEISKIEKEREYQKFKSKIGDIIIGVIKKIDDNGLLLDINGTEAFVRNENLVPGENYRIKNTIKVYVKGVVQDSDGPQIILSRTDNGMLSRLLELEVPEIYDGIVEIKGVARKPGSQAKVALFSRDVNINPITCCIGIRGSRINSISSELNGEKIDLVLWDPDLERFIINAFERAEVARVTIKNDFDPIDVIVSTATLPMAIGRAGQHVRLVSKLIGRKINVMNEEEDSKKRIEEFNNTSQMFIEILDIEEIMAQLLTASGYSHVQQIADASVASLSKIDGFDEELAQILKERACRYVEDKQNMLLDQLEEAGFTQDLLDILGEVDLQHLLALAQSGIKSVEDLSLITPRQFKRIVPYCLLSEEQISEYINHAKLLNISESPNEDREKQGSL